MRTVESEIGSILAGSISEITQRSIFRRLGGMARAPLQHLSTQDRHTIQAELASSVRLFAPAKSAQLIASCARALALLGPPAAAGPHSAAGAPASPAHRAAPLSGPAAPAALGKDQRLAIDGEKDIASARLEAWSEAVRLGLSKLASVKVATAVSELARNIVFYAGEGQIELRSAVEGASARLEIVARDGGPGIDRAKLDEIYAGSYRSARGMGKGLMAVKKLVDDFQLDTAPGRGTLVTCLFRGDR